ncbi:MAG: class A beta-lactamase-related serine hydrolase [Gemmatimonadales bacterium]|nr:MAG: class A beta-lactamase-related serine hydrolase [Gemmatimonadales bacterium]
MAVAAPSGPSAPVPSAPSGRHFVPSNRCGRDRKSQGRRQSPRPGGAGGHRRAAGRLTIGCHLPTATLPHGVDTMLFDGLEPQLESLLDEVFARSEIHSATMAVASGAGDFRWAGARGEISPAGPATKPDTPWFTASITKLFIAGTVMRMVEEGELALEDRLVGRLPGAITHRLHVLKGEDRTGEITVEHLLAHASGLPDFIEDHPPKGGPAGRDRRSLVDILLEEGDRDWPLEETSRRVREALAPHFPPQKLRGPRVRIRYSDTNYQLLTGIVEARRNTSFADALEALVLEPLELDDTWIPGHPRGGKPEAEVPTLYAGTEIVEFPRFFASISDLHATSDDLVRFLRAVEEGRLFRSPATWERMQARWNRFPLPRDRASLRQPGWPIEYGLGVMRFHLPRALTPFRPVPAVIGHTGSTGTWLFHARELDLYLAGAVNQVTAGAVPFRLVPEVLRAAMAARR